MLPYALSYISTAVRLLTVQVKPYEALLGDVSAAAASGARLWLDPARVSYAVYQAAAAAAKGEREGGACVSVGGRGEG